MADIDTVNVPDVIDPNIGGTTDDESTETDVSKIPYPEGTAPPELNDAVHADIQYTLTEAIIDYIKTYVEEHSGAPVPESTLAKWRSLSATELMYTLVAKPIPGAPMPNELSLAEILPMFMKETSGPTYVLPKPYPTLYYTGTSSDNYQVAAFGNGDTYQGGKTNRFHLVLVNMEDNMVRQKTVKHVASALIMPIGDSPFNVMYFPVNSLYGFLVGFSDGSRKVIQEASFVKATFSVSADEAVTFNGPAKKQVKVSLMATFEIGEVLHLNIPKDCFLGNKILLAKAGDFDFKASVGSVNQDYYYATRFEVTASGIYLTIFYAGNEAKTFEKGDKLGDIDIHPRPVHESYYGEDITKFIDYSDGWDTELDSDSGDAGDNDQGGTPTK